MPSVVLQNSHLDSAFSSDCGVDATEEGVTVVNRLVLRLVIVFEMSRLRPSRSHTILYLLLAVRSNGLEQVVDVLASLIIGVIAAVCRSAVWSA